MPRYPEEETTSITRIPRGVETITAAEEVPFKSRAPTITTERSVTKAPKLTDSCEKQTTFKENETTEILEVARYVSQSPRHDFETHVEFYVKSKLGRESSDSTEQQPLKYGYSTEPRNIFYTTYLAQLTRTLRHCYKGVVQKKLPLGAKTYFE